MKQGLMIEMLFSVVAVGALAFARPPAPTSTSYKQDVLVRHQHPYGLDEKGGGQLEVTLGSDVASPIPASTNFTLTATITASSALQDLRYEWILPNGVTIVTGNAGGTFGDVQEGMSVESKITLVSSTDQNRQVHLHVYRLVGGEAQGQMAQFNTRDQAKIVSAMQAKAEALGKDQREPASTHRHIMQ